MAPQLACQGYITRVFFSIQLRISLIKGGLLLYDNPHQLDEEVKRFLFAANEIITHEWSPDLVRIVYLQEMTARIDGELLYGLNSLVNQLSLESQKKSNN